MKIAEILNEVKNSSCMDFYDCYDGSIRITIHDMEDVDEDWNPIEPEEYDEGEVYQLLYSLKTKCETWNKARMYPEFILEDGTISVEWDSYGI